MGAKYDFRENPPQGGNGEKSGLHPRVVLNGTKTTEDIVADISKYSSFRPGDVRGVLTEFFEYLGNSLGDGYNVKIDDVGSFSVTLTSPPVEDRSEIRASSVSFKSVKFHPTRDFMRRIRRDRHLERVDKYRGFSSSATGTTQAQRLEKLKDYLQEHAYITRQEYSNLTGLLRSKASKDLKEFEEMNVVVCNGRKPHYIYTLVQEKTENER